MNEDVDGVPDHEVREQRVESDAGEAGVVVGDPGQQLYHRTVTNLNKMNGISALVITSLIGHQGSGVNESRDLSKYLIHNSSSYQY